MKSMKKILAFALVLVMLTALSATAFAATITINQVVPEGATAGAETYNLYKIFDVTKTSDVSEPVTSQTTLGPGTATGFAYTISTSNPWFAKLGSVSNGTWTAASGQTWVTLTKSAGSDTLYNVTWAGENTADAAKAFAAFLKANKGTIAANETMTSSNGTATKTVADGYWLIDSSLGTNLVLATSNITINTKNSYPTTTKTASTTNYNVGDKVPYTINVVIPASADYTKTVTVHDTMDNVLAIDTTSIHAKVSAANDFDSHITYVASTSFGTDHATNHAAADGKVLFDFVLDISSLAPASGSTPTEKTITITYEAELLSDAAADTGYVNKEFVEYSKYTTPETPPVTIKTYDFQLKKTFGGKTASTLEATFILVTDPDNESTTTIQFIKDNTGYVKKDSDDQNASATLTVKGDATGINVRGLAAGDYYLIEKTTADGYNLLTTPIKVTIDADGNATLGNTGDLFSAADGVITVDNQAGLVLPSTGGVGTTLFYIIGSILVLGAGVVLVTKRRVKE